MSGFKHVHTKYMAMMIAVVVFSFSVLAGLFFGFVRSITLDEQRHTVNNTLENVTSLMTMALNEDSISTRESYFYIIDTVAANSETHILFVNKSGELLYESDNEDSLHSSRHLSKSLMDSLEGRDTIEGFHTLDNFYHSKRYVMGNILYAHVSLPNGTVSTTPAAWVFVSLDTSANTSLMVTLLRSFATILAVVLLGSLAAVFFSTRKLVSPLKQISAAARRFGRGDLSARVEVVGSDEVAELSVAFNNMADSLAKSEEERRSFIANVSHDLRTPMTSISGFIDGILDGTIPPEEQTHYLTLASDETKRLSRLVRDLLDLSRLENSETVFHTENFDLSETVLQVVFSSEAAINKKQLEVDLNLPELPQQILADPDATHRVLYNLVDNAIKFSNEGGLLRITLTRVRGFIQCTVYNTGVGIPAEDLPFVFDRFYKADHSRGLDKKGLGLGLHIVKTLVDRQGGSISVSSREGEFCAFTVQLPTPPTDKLTLPDKN